MGCTRQALDFVHALLTWDQEADPDRLLQGLARAFATDGAAFAGPFPGAPFLEYRLWLDGSTMAPSWQPWIEHPGLVVQPVSGVPARPVRLADKGFALVACLPHPTGNWLVWLVRTATNRWDNCDGRVLALAGQALLQVLLADISAHVGSVPVDRVRMHERMADAGRLVRRLAHDFDNVLTGVLGFGELAQQQLTAGSPARRYLGELLQAAERGTELTDRLRRFSHGQEINGAQAYLGEVLSQEEAQQKKGLPAAITWVTEVPAHLPRVAMGAEPLRLVLQHLLANAREAIGVAGTITVSATLSLLGGRECLQVLGSPAPGSYVRLVIRDSGPGLSKESQHRVLVEPFYTSKPGHPGLGLPTVFRIVSAHGGGLRLGPSQPHGTQVEVFLPLQPPVASKQ